MSESYGYVCCTCFREGRTTAPPRADIALGLDAFGNIVIPGTDPHDILDDLDEWVFDDACPHHHGRLVEEIFLNVRRRKDELGAAALARGLATIHDVLVNRAGYGFDGIIVPATLAPAVLEELHRAPASLSEHEDYAYDLTMLCRLCEASVSTGNPVVWYYSGHSLGY